MAYYYLCVDVYIELVIFNNFFVDLSLLLATLTVRKRKAKKWRIFLATLVGSAAATAYAVVPTWAQYVIKAVLAPVMCILLTSPQGKSTLYKFGDFVGTTLVFVLFTFFAGGIVEGLSHALGVDVKSYATLGLVAAGVCILLVSARLVVHKRSTSAKRICETVITVKGERASVTALCDSGNLLVDDASGLPVVILSKSVEDRLNVCDLKGFIRVSTISGEDSMPLVGLDGVEIDGRQYNALGALSHRDFDAFDVILQNSMF